jgi:hypothetical protein
VSNRKSLIETTSWVYAIFLLLFILVVLGNCFGVLE